METPPTMEALQEQAIANGWYEGVPVPVHDLRVTVCETHPLKPYLEPLLNLVEQRRMCSSGDVDETSTIRNSWRHSTIRGVTVHLMQIGSRVEAYLSGENPVAAMLLNTVGASAAWTVAAEERALSKLASLITPHAYSQYRLVDMFLERSPRSGLTYLFRKLRPTVVLTPHRHPDRMEILTTLCMHPLGYYQGSWAGCMTPTDDVLSHLLLMRGDEHEYWKRAEQHPPDEPEAGIF